MKENYGQYPSNEDFPRPLYISIYRIERTHSHYVAQITSSTSRGVHYQDRPGKKPPGIAPNVVRTDRALLSIGTDTEEPAPSIKYTSSVTYKYVALGYGRDEMG